MTHRKFRDGAGGEWEVWDTIPSEIVHTAQEGGWLTFRSAAEKRRLAPIPLYWVSATDAELGELLGRAAPAPKVHDRQSSHDGGPPVDRGDDSASSV